MNEWLTNLLVAVILLCVWALAVLYYLSKMDRKNEEIKQACTERVIGRIDRITSFFSTGKNGMPIELYCNPSRPSQFYCPAEDRNMTAAKVVNVSLVTVFAAVILITLLVERM